MSPTTISFRGAFSSHLLETEVLPRLFYGAARKAKRQGELNIDLTRVHWFDLFPLALFTLNLYKLAESWPSIHIRFPATTPLEDERFPGILQEVPTLAYLDRREACSFLDRWQFPQIVDQDPLLGNISHDKATKLYDVWTRSKSNLIGDILELTPCVDTTSLQVLEGFLDKESSLARVFDQWAQLSIVESRDLAKVIVRNLGENIIEHASLDRDSTRLRAFFGMRLVKPLAALSNKGAPQN